MSTAANKYDIDLVEAHPLSARMIGFIDHLRLNDFAIGPAETKMALQVLGKSLSPLGDVRQKLKILLTGRTEEWRRFDDLFEAYWLKRARRHDQAASNAKRKEKSPRNLPNMWRDQFSSDDQNQTGRPQIDAQGEEMGIQAASGRLIASHQSARFKTDLRYIVDRDEIQQSEQLAYRLARAMRYRLSRRRRQAKSGRQLDLRRTIRRNLAHGGDPLELKYMRRPERPVRLVVFLDVSGSMKHYSRFFLQFIKGLEQIL